MADMLTLKQIANKYAKKQPGLVDNLLEEAPILTHLKWKAATHGIKNVAEELVDIKGAGFVNFNAPLSRAEMSTNLREFPVHTLGCVIEVPKDTASQLGGKEKYFADREPKFLKKAGVDTEVSLFYNYWLQEAIAANEVIKTGATNGKGYTILAVRFDEDCNVGIYDPEQFSSGYFMQRELLNGGNLYTLPDGPYKGVNGYGVELRGRFGWQLLQAKKYVAAIVNVQKGKAPTRDQLDDLLAMVHAGNGNTFLFMHEKAKIYSVNQYKENVSQITIVDSETKVNTNVASWNGVPIVTSYNLVDGEEFITIA